jgi:two-component system phosphate regulon sensor histidine kinase PhoR
MAIGCLCPDRKKSTAEHLDPAAVRVAGAPPRIGIAMDQDGDLADGNFPATLLAMAGHDLRQPLQVITSAHDVLAQSLQAEKQRKELMRAEDATARLAGMLDQLVEAMQLHRRSGHCHVSVQLCPILDALAAEFAKSARLKGITFHVSAGDRAVRSHPVLLTGMLRNLIRNAIDYTPSGGGVFVTCRRYGSELHIEVRDTGVGIPADALSSIFEAFQRADKTRTNGLGLGLFIVKHAANLLGHGSCFTVVAGAVQCSGSQPREVEARPGSAPPA